MEESQEILLRSLESAGVEIPGDVSSIRDLTPPLLLSISVQSVRLIDATCPVRPSFPSAAAAADRFRICSQLASAVTKLGYVGEMSFHKFLYPSQEDSYKLVRFFVKKLSECSDRVKSQNEDTITDPGTSEIEETTSKAAAPIEDKWLHSNFQNVSDSLKNLNLRTNVPEASDSNSENAHLEITDKIDNLQSVEKVLLEEGTAKGLEFKMLSQEHEMLKAAVEMAFDEHHSVHFYIEQLARQVEEKRNNLAEQESRWDASIKSLEEKKRCLEESLYANSQEAKKKLQKFKEAELETQSILSQATKREEEWAKLSADVEKQLKQVPRRFYIHRISEITKNSRKQDADMERILKETRELQLESNSVHESLHRTYGVVEETVYREAKKDPVGRQAYRLLTSIHGTFEQISDKILATDRTRREAAEHEVKLAAMASQSLNVEKLKGDLEAIRKENDYLEHHHQDT